MRKWQKILMWGIGSLLIASAVGVVAVRTLTDEAHLKALVHDKMQQMWGRDLQADQLTFRLFPYPQLHATGVTVSNPAWAQDKHFLQAADVSARLALMPLFAGRVVVRRLDFDGLTANLEVAPDGRRNWDVPRTGDDDASAYKLPQVLEKMDLRALHVRNSNVVLRKGRQPAAFWQVPDLRVDSNKGLRDVVFALRMERNGHQLQANGRLGDLSRFGAPGASSEGRIHVQAGSAVASIDGRLPLDADLKNYSVKVAVDAGSMQEVYGFFGIQRRSPAALKASAAFEAAGQKIEVKDFKLHLGRLHASGAMEINRAGAKPAFNAQLQADHIDMVQTFLDAGQPPLRPKPAGELFHDSPLAWPLLVALDGIEGKLETHIASLKLRSGIDVTDVAARVAVNGDRMTVGHFSGKLLGGTATGDAVFEGRNKAVHLNLRLADTSLGQGFKETGKELTMRGGPMQVDAHISAVGSSMKDLAASVTGPVDIRVGAARIDSSEAGNAEFWMNGLFSAKNAQQIDLACASARLPFQSGVAKGVGIAGARSDASQLLASGTVDMRAQNVDLHGRVRARSGISLGISTFSGDVKIVGKIARPELNLDEAGIVGALARIGAAIVTSGASIIATSIWDGANPESDPCQIVFSPKAKAAKAAPKSTLRRKSAP